MNKTVKKTTTVTTIDVEDAHHVDGDEDEMLAAFGYTSSNCFNCGKHYSEIDTYLIQCGKCKKAYYCNQSCFNEHLPEHLKFCRPVEEGINVEGLSRSPNTKRQHLEKTKKTALQETTKFDITVDGPDGIDIIVTEIEEGLYRAEVPGNRKPKDFEIKVQDGNKEKYAGNFPNGTLFRYFDAGKGEPQMTRVKDPKHGTIRQYFGHGDLRLQAKDKKTGEKSKVTVPPTKPPLPKIEVEVVDPETNLYKLIAKDEKGGEVELDTSNPQGGRGKSYDDNTLLDGTLFRYIKAGEGKPNRQKEYKDDKFGTVKHLYGNGDLEIIAKTPAGDEATAIVHPADTSGVPEPIVPKVKVQTVDKEKGIYRLLVVNKEDGEPVDPGRIDIQALEVENEMEFPNAKLKQGSIFRYTQLYDPKKKFCTSTTVEDPTHGTVINLYGRGNMDVIATTDEGKTDKKVVPSSTFVPTITIKQVNEENGIYQLTASDPTGEPLEQILGLDKEKTMFDRLNPKRENAYIKYTTAGKHKSKSRTLEEEYNGEPVEDMYGQGTMDIFAVSFNGQRAVVQVEPAEPSGPTLVIKDIGNGLKEVTAEDADGKPVDITVTDSEGTKFKTWKAGNKTVVKYINAGNHESDEETKTVPGHDGDVKWICGKGDLVVSAKDRNDKLTTRKIAPLEAAPPVITLEKMGDDVYKVVLTDESDEPVTLETKNGGHKFDNIKNGSLIKYIDTGKNDQKQSTIKHPEHGDVHQLYGSGDLELTAENIFGKTATTTHQGAEANPPRITTTEVSPGIFKVSVSDESGEPVTIQAVNDDGNVLDEIPIIDGSLIQYTDAGKGGREESLIKDPKHGEVRKLLGHGKLKLTATNAAGKKADATIQPAEAAPPKITTTEVAPGIFKVNFSDEGGSPVKVQAVNDDGNVLEETPIVDGALIQYIDAGKGGKEESVIEDPKHGKIRKLLGHGKLKLTATNKAGKKADAAIKPFEAAKPRISTTEVAPGIFKVNVSDESGGPLTIQAVNDDGNVLEEIPIVDGTLIQYIDAGKGGKEESITKNVKHGEVRKLLGHGKLKLTATNKAGKKADAAIKPTEAAPPKITTKEVAPGIFKVNISDESGGPLIIQAVNDDGNVLEETPIVDGSLIQYIDAGKGGKEESITKDPKHGAVRKLLGHGRLKLTATNKAGKKADAAIQPTEACPPKLQLEEIEPGFYKVLASDESGSPVSVKASDSEGNAFKDSSVAPGSIIRYFDAGDGSSNEKEIDHPQHGKVSVLYGKGDLSLIATNKAGKEAKEALKPMEVSPPTLELEEIEPNLYKVVAYDETGDPITITAVDSAGNKFKKNVQPGALIRYNDNEKDAGKQNETKDPVHGTVQVLSGKGDLQLTATNSVGKKATASIKGFVAPPPKLEAEKIGDNLYRLIASDESGKPLSIKAEDSKGNKLGVMEPGDIFQYFEAGALPSTMSEIPDDTHGKVKKIVGQGKLKITAKNEAGKKAKATVEPAEIPPPTLKAVLVNEEKGIYQVVASDPNGEPVTIKGADSKRNKLADEIVPGTLFTYTAGPFQCTETDDPEHGKVKQIQGSGNLHLTCYNKSGKYTDIELEPRKPVLRDKEYVPKPKTEELVLTKNMADKLIYWWGRFHFCSKKDMKRKIKKLDPMYELTPEMVDLLPWIIRDTRIATKDLQRLIMTDEEKEAEAEKK